MSDDARHVDMEEALTDYSAKLREAGRLAHPSWKIVDYQNMETRNGIAFSCKVTANGRVVADVEQGGNGVSVPPQRRAGADVPSEGRRRAEHGPTAEEATEGVAEEGDRKSTRLNSSHVSESRMPSSA